MVPRLIQAHDIAVYPLKILVKPFDGSDNQTFLTEHSEMRCEGSNKKAPAAFMSRRVIMAETGPAAAGCIWPAHRLNLLPVTCFVASVRY